MDNISKDDHWSYHLPLHTISMASFIFLVAGLGLVFIGTAYPRSYVFDINKPARVMEGIEQYYARLGRDLDIIILVGMGSLTFSAFLASFVLTALWCRGLSMYNGEMDEDTFLIFGGGRDEVTMNDYPRSYGATR